MPYQIKNWDETFENYKSRSVDECSFVCVPNKQHGLGFTRIMLLPDGAMIYGIWNLILGACSRQKRPRDGWLTDDGKPNGIPWRTEEMATRWRRDVAEIEKALLVLSGPEIDWIKPDTEVPAQYPEGKKEGKVLAIPTRSGAVPPKLEEWLTNAQFIGYDPTEAATAWNGLEAMGWEKDGYPIKDWRKLQVVYRDRLAERNQKEKMRASYNPISKPRVDGGQGTTNDGKASQYRGVGKVGGIPDTR